MPSDPATEADESYRPPPLNLTADEAEALWEMVMIGIGSTDIQYSDQREAAESAHGKVKDIQRGVDGD